MLVRARDSEALPDGGKETSTKDVVGALPSAVKHQALRDARSVWRRSCERGELPVLPRPIGPGTKQNGRLEGGTRLLPVGPRMVVWGRSPAVAQL